MSIRKYFDEAGELPAEILKGAWSRGLRQRLAILYLFEEDLDCLIQLLVFAGKLLERVVVEENVRIDAMILDDPFAGFRTIVGEEWHTYIGTIHEWE